MLLTSIAQEFLGYAFKSNNLGQSIEKIYTDLLNYKRELQARFDLNNPEKATKYSITLLEYFDKITLKALTKLLKNQCNILITKSIVNKQGSPFDITIQGLIAILPDYNKTVFQLLSKLQKIGYFGIKPTDDFHKIINKLQQSYNTYNPKTGKLAIPVESILMLEPNLILFPERTYSSVKPFTAKELTAITLHEIGHVYETTLSILNISNNAYNLNHLFMQFYNMSPTDIYKFIKRNQTILEQDTEDKKISELIPQKERKKIIDQINTIVESINTSQTFNQILNQRTLMVLYGKISAILTIVRIWLQSLKFNMFSYLHEAITKFLVIAESHETPHFTIEPITSNSYNMMEINADLFVVLHGYQDSLISGLDKISKIFTIVSTNQYGPVIASYELSRVVMFMCEIFNLWYYLSKILPVYLISTGITRDTYKLLCERYENALYNAYATLKKQNIPSKELNRILKHIEQTKNNIDKSLEYFSAKYIQKFWDIVLGIEPAMFIIRLLHDANFTGEITKLLSTFDKIINNSLYYHSAKLKDILTQRR